MEKHEFEEAKTHQEAIYAQLLSRKSELHEKIKMKLSQNNELKKDIGKLEQSINVLDKKKEALGLEEMNSEVIEIKDYTATLHDEESTLQGEMKEKVEKLATELKTLGSSMDQLHSEFKSPDCLKNGTKTLACKVEETKMEIDIKTHQIQELGPQIEKKRRVALIDLDMVKIISEDAESKLKSIQMESENIKKEFHQLKTPDVSSRTTQFGRGSFSGGMFSKFQSQTSKFK